MPLPPRQPAPSPSNQQNPAPTLATCVHFFSLRAARTAKNSGSIAPCIAPAGDCGRTADCAGARRPDAVTIRAGAMRA